VNIEGLSAKQLARYAVIPLTGQLALYRTGLAPFTVAFTLGRVKSRTGTAARVTKPSDVLCCVVRETERRRVLAVLGIGERGWREHVRQWEAVHMAHRCRRGEVTLFLTPDHACPNCHGNFLYLTTWVVGAEPTLPEERNLGFRNREPTVPESVPDAETGNGVKKRVPWGTMDSGSLDVGFLNSTDGSGTDFKNARERAEARRRVAGEAAAAAAGNLFVATRDLNGRGIRAPDGRLWTAYKLGRYLGVA
jgi:hypothetical protein